jgi:hypothetical protein
LRPPVFSNDVLSIHPSKRTQSVVERVDIWG